MGYIPKDDKEYCKFYDPKTLGCFKGGHCTKIHLPKDEMGYTQDTRPAKISIRKASLPEVGSEIISGVVTCVVNPEICYVHLDVNSETRLSLMNDAITNAVKTNELRPIKMKPQKFDLVTACYEGYWYRAQIVDFSSGEGYRVSFHTFFCSLSYLMIMFFFMCFRCAMLIMEIPILLAVMKYECGAKNTIICHTLRIEFALRMLIQTRRRWLKQQGT